MTYFSASMLGKENLCLKEYLQYKILRAIFNSEHGNKLSFLWWTALRIVYDNPRFSEDLDFDNFNLSFEEFDDLSQVIKRELELEWLIVETQIVKKGAFHCNIKIPELLYKNHLAPMGNTKILIQVDTVSQWYNYKPITTNISKFDTQTTILNCSTELILAQKLFCCFERKRIKWRDFYDIVFLLWKTKSPDLNYLSEKLWISDNKELKKYILKNCVWLDFEYLHKDVAPFLFDPTTQAIKMFPQIIEQTEFGV